MASGQTIWSEPNRIRLPAAKVASRCAASSVATIFFPVTGLPTRASQHASLSIACMCMSMILSGGAGGGAARSGAATRLVIPATRTRTTLLMVLVILYAPL